MHAMLLRDVYHGLGNIYLIHAKVFQIGIGIGHFPQSKMEELQIGIFVEFVMKGGTYRYRWWD